MGGGGAGGAGGEETRGPHDPHLQFWVECHCAGHSRAEGKMFAIVTLLVVTDQAVHALVFLDEAKSSADPTHSIQLE